ncbi:UDP-glucose 4-epimerase [Mortierella sp. GBAus27b]|nr:UDP-glucose 4-epimerase [Mortierella sp. GBAus27b]
MTVPVPRQDHQDTILVTGGAGYIGSHTVVQLLDLGKRIVVIDNLSNSSEESLHRAVALSRNSRPDSLIFHKVDLLDCPGLEHIFQLYHFSACLHFAGLKAVGESSQIPLGYYQTNITGTLNLVQLLQKYNCRNLIFSSSATVYGLPCSDRPIQEDAPTGAMNPYGRTKQYIEEILRDTANSEPNQWNIILLRYFNPVGAHESGMLGEDPNGTPNNLMPYVAQVAIGRRPTIQVFGNDYDTKDGTGVRDYIHIDDLARGHVAALKKIEQLDKTATSKTSLGCIPFNLGTGVGYSVMEMIRSMSEVVGRPLPYKVVARRPGDVATVIADPALAAKELNWKAEKTLKDMCRDLWRWQTLNPEGYSGTGTEGQDSISTPLTPVIPDSETIVPTAQD